MQAVTVYSLIDITETAVVRSFKVDQIPYTTRTNIEINSEEVWTFSRKQQSNYEVLLQVLSLRTQPLNINGPRAYTNRSLSGYKFGKSFKGKHNVWILEFESESVDALAIDDNPVGALMQDVNNVPMLPNLTETIKVNTHFNCTTDCNIYFESSNK